MSLFKTKTFYKIFVTKDFPRVYEQRVFFHDDDTNSDTAVVQESYYVNEPYNEHWVDEINLKKPDWHWELEEVEKDFERRRLALMARKNREIDIIEDHLAELRGMSFSHSNIETDDFCKNRFPTGKQEQLDRYKKIREKIKKKRLKKELASHEAKVKELKAKMEEIG
jgi:hypothetical protein